MEPDSDAGTDRKPVWDATVNALRAEVVSTGRDTRQMRILIAWSLAIALPVLIAAVGMATGIEGLMVAGACFGPVIFGLVGYSVAVGMVERYHQRYRVRLRERFAALPQEQRTELLESLSREPEGDTRQIVAPLLREPAPQPREIAPSAAPEGTGQELNPAIPRAESESVASSTGPEIPRE